MKITEAVKSQLDEANAFLTDMIDEMAAQHRDFPNRTQDERVVALTGALDIMFNRPQRTAMLALAIDLLAGPAA
jgi:hypothetical protein